MAEIADIKQALAAYTGDPETLNRFVEAATAALGENWAETIYDTLTDLTPEERERLDHAFQYHAATTAWNEVQGYLALETITDAAAIRERIPVLEHWLGFFQEAGLQVVDQLKQKLDAAVSSESVSSTADTSAVPQDEMAGSETKETSIAEEAREPQTPTAKEPQPQSESLFMYDRICRQIELTRDVQAWVTARCVDMDQREVYTYPHYGFVVDLMSQTKKEIQNLLDRADALAEINAVHPDGITELQNYQTSLIQDLETAAQNGVSEETDLIDDGVTGKDARRILGELDTSQIPEFSGPAPDGFEVVMEDTPVLDEEPIREEYRQIENVVLSEQSQNNEKNTSQTAQNGVKRKLSFSLGNKKPTGT